MTRTVAFFSGFYVPFFGGIERYTYNISKKLVARGYRVIIITSKHSNDLSHESIEEGIKIYRLPIYNFGKKRYPFPRKNKTYKELLKKIKAENIDYFVINTRFELPLTNWSKNSERARKASYCYRAWDDLSYNQ